jgi:hypothetical protein
MKWQKTLQKFCTNFAKIAGRKETIQLKPVFGHS